MVKKCIICQTDRHLKKVGTPSFFGFEIRLCSKCNLIFTFEEDEKIRKLSRNYYKKYSKEKKGTRKGVKKTIYTLITTILTFLNKGSWSARSHFYFMESFINPEKGKILEVGSGNGRSLVFWRSIGYNVTGVEPDQKLAQIVNHRFGDNVCINSFIEDFEVDDVYDIIYLNNVFEHLIRPDHFLHQARGLLKEEGVLFLAVPNCQNSDIRAASFKTIHEFHFTPDSLKKLLQTYGYRILKMGTFTECNHSNFSRLLSILLNKNRLERSSPEKGTEILVVARPT